MSKNDASPVCPKEGPMTLYEQVMMLRPEFGSTKQALDHYVKEYEELGNMYDMTGDEFWFHAESCPILNEDMNKIMSLRRRIGMCEYLLKKENSIK